jgi:hypothetical protein
MRDHGGRTFVGLILGGIVVLIAVAGIAVYSTQTTPPGEKKPQLTVGMPKPTIPKKNLDP